MHTMTIRKVLYSERFGVFLGIKDRKAVWSKIAAELTGRELAPTFLDNDDYVRYVNKELNLDEDKKVIMADWYMYDPDVRMREVLQHYGADTSVASMQECVGAGIPGWGEQ